MVSKRHTTWRKHSTNKPAEVGTDARQSIQVGDQVQDILHLRGCSGEVGHSVFVNDTIGKGMTQSNYCIEVLVEGVVL